MEARDDRRLMTPESDVQMSGTAEGLLAFLEWAIRTGELSSNTAAAYKTAITQVLEIDGDAWRATSLRELDVDRQLDRFTRLRGSRYSPASLKTYKNRVSAARSHYLTYLANPATFRAASTRPKRGRDEARAEKYSSDSQPRIRERGSRGAPVRPEDPVANTELVQYPFPLRPDSLVYLSLPRDLRRSEAERIAAFVASLAMDPVTDRGTSSRKDL